MKLSPFIAFFIAVIAIFPGCKDDSGNKVPLTNISATPTKLSMVVGESRQIEATAVPENANPQEMPFLWESQDSKIASVSSSGMVNAVSAGKTNIFITARMNKKIQTIIPITVVNADVPLTGIIVDPESVNVNVDETQKIVATPEPEDATGILFLWSSDNNAIATVNSSGTVKGISKGNTYVNVKSGDIEKKIPVTVNQVFKITIGNATYEVDTLKYEKISEGIEWLKFSLPEFTNGFGTLGKGLVVNAVEVDLTYPENKLEVWTAMLNRGNSNRERPSTAFNYEATVMEGLGRKPVAMTNGDFYLLDANLPDVINKNTNALYSGYQRRRAHGVEVKHGKIIETPFTDINSTLHNKALIIRDNGLPDFAENISISGSVKIGNSTMTLSNINSFVRDNVSSADPRKHPAKQGELVLFNNEAFSFLDQTHVLDSALAWSPYPSTMVSLSYPKDGWKVNESMKFTVTAIDYDVETQPTVSAGTVLDNYGGKRFNGQGAILVGNPSAPGLDNGAKQFLSSLKVGDEIEITTEVNINGNKVNDKKLSAIGIHTERPMLRNGVVSETWGEAHPRTVIGYSSDQKKAYLLVIDGRSANYSVGVTTGQAGAILKALGAHTGLNLDGGGSSAMIVNGETANKPSDDPQRVVANGLMITTKK